MTYSYFPGCTLKTTGTALDHCGRQAAQALGIRLEEIPDWQCCGGVYPMARDEIATRLSSVRALCAARETGGKLVTMCSACYHVLRRVNNDMRTQGDIRRRSTTISGWKFPMAERQRLCITWRFCGMKSAGKP